ncbi:MAG: DUF3078 domain-containing protein [Bacteroidales bacterium]|nr:DUF3078 domain-containing protein [Bacteroidales bacterium]
MKRLFVTMAALAAFVGLYAEDNGWNHNGMVGVNASQTSFTNWSAGGENSVSGNAYFNGSLSFKSDKASWTNDLDANFGMVNTESLGWRKNVDNLHFASKYGRNIGDKGHFYYAGLLDFKTQFAAGYDYAATPNRKVSDFLTPAYLNLSVGIDYKPGEHFSLFYSPVAGKLTYVSDTTFSTAYGVKKGENMRWELGSTAKIAVSYNFFGDMLTLKSNADFFTPYNDSFGNVDVNWELLLGYHLSKYITLTFQYNLKYDDDIKYVDPEGNQHGPRIQSKEVLGLGLSYKF